MADKIVQFVGCLAEDDADPYCPICGRTEGEWSVGMANFRTCAYVQITCRSCAEWAVQVSTLILDVPEGGVN